jgi:hypothetical protein
VAGERGRDLSIACSSSRTWAYTLVCVRQAVGGTWTLSMFFRAVVRRQSHRCEQWALIAPLLPHVNIGRRRGSKRPARSWTARGCAWRQLAENFRSGRRSTGGNRTNVTGKILPVCVSNFAGRAPQSAAERRTDRLAERAGRRHSSGATPAGRTPGRRSTAGSGSIVPHAVGLLLIVAVLSVSVQDRDGDKPVLLSTYPATGVRFVFAGGAFVERLLGSEWQAADGGRTYAPAPSRSISTGLGRVRDQVLRTLIDDHPCMNTCITASPRW